MSSFEDRLWSELVREHGDALAGAGAGGDRAAGAKGNTGARAWRLTRPRHSWRASLVAGAIALTAAIVAGALLLTASASPPAYAVVVDPDGSVTLTINQLVGVSAANARLAKLGVRARVAIIEPGCTAKGVHVELPLPQRTARSEPWIAQMWRPEKVWRQEDAHPGFGGVGLVIRPAGIPKGDTLLMTARRIDGTHARIPFHAVGLSMGLYRGPAPSCVRGP
jgi:hypothetical protein